MKPTTKEWLAAAEDDLLSARKLVDDPRLTNVVTFHCQQCIEKALKGILEEENKKIIKSHDLLRLTEMAAITLSDDELTILATINEVYIDSRYPGDMGLMPMGKPTTDEANSFIDFSTIMFEKIQSNLTE